jgi:CRISPR/Cas system-associated exonuclease Cas4 (RecB family)
MVAWSHSVMDSYETCPWRHYLTKVTKEVKESQSAEMAWGNQVHQALEHRVKKGTPLPANMVQYEKIAAPLHAKAWSDGVVVQVEGKMAINASFEPRTYFAKDVWCRAITDLTLVRGPKALVIDYKTGNPKPNSSQLRLTAAFTFHHYPDVQQIRNTFLWLKTGETTDETFVRSQIGEIWSEFLPKVERLEKAIADDNWPKKPSGLCKNWCPVPHSRCEFRSGR